MALRAKELDVAADGLTPVKGGAEDCAAAVVEVTSRLSAIELEVEP